MTGGATVYVNSSGQLGVSSSSRRFKQDIHSLGPTSQKILSLRPVTFRYKQADEKGAYPLQYGLIAEEVAKVFPELVQYDENGKPFAVYYNLLTPLMLGELQHEHTEVQKQQATNTTLRAENQRLVQEITSVREQLTAQAAQMAAFGEKFNILQRRIEADVNLIGSQKPIVASR